MQIGYARASLERQAIDRQLDELAAAGAQQIYQEKVTGTMRDRPELNRMLEEMKPGETITVVELSRVSRSTKDLLEIVDLIHKKGGHFRSLNESWLDTTTPQGQLIFTIFAGLCQFERDLIAERTKSGLKAGEGIVAVDPKVIPLHSKLYIEILDESIPDYGYCVAGDTGSKIKGNKVDLFFNADRQTLLQFGVRNAKVYILETP
jgi:3D (Asp-Asp-Asp) domain-containing protein